MPHIRKRANHVNEIKTTNQLFRDRCADSGRQLWLHHYSRGRAAQIARVANFRTWTY